MSAINHPRFLRKSLITRGALVALVASSILSAGVAVSEEAGDSRLEAAILERIKPVAQVNVARAGAAPAAARTGEQVVGAVCNACHGTGALGAPKIGDGAEWSKRLGAAGGNVAGDDVDVALEGPDGQGVDTDHGRGIVARVLSWGHARHTP